MQRKENDRRLLASAIGIGFNLNYKAAIAINLREIPSERDSKAEKLVKTRKKKFVKKSIKRLKAARNQKKIIGMQIRAETGCYQFKC